MATTQELLAKSLAKLKSLHDKGHLVVVSDELSPTDRKRLMAAGYLKSITRGWYLTSRPDEKEGDTTLWQASWKEFVWRYCESRFQTNWTLSPEQSLHLITATPLPTRQIHIYAKEGQNNSTPLIDDWSIFDLKGGAFASDGTNNESDVIDGVRTMTLSYALTQVSETFFRNQSVTAQLALSLVTDTSDIARVLLATGKTVVAGRLIGAFRAIGADDHATNLFKALEAAGHRIVVTNPFAATPILIDPAIKKSPYVLRIHQMWAAMREPIMTTFGDPPGIPTNTSAYLADIAARYAADAYNSLSIEGYNVTDDLIARVRSGDWDMHNEDDKKSRDAMAAKGYSLAHAAVIKTIEKILAGENAGTTLRSTLIDWHLALWKPSVQAGILKPEELAGYRNSPVYIRNADHVPPPKEAVRDLMPEFFSLLERETHAGVRAVLGHFIFVFIHPYMDGNGRLGRFIMNAMLASGGYPWLVVPVTRRSEYLAALNEASGKGNIRPFTHFLMALQTAQ
jgi:Fic/DOC family